MVENVNYQSFTPRLKETKAENFNVDIKLVDACWAPLALGLKRAEASERL
jgi:hypothetical protein